MDKIKYIFLLLSLSILYIAGIQAQTISIHHPHLKFLFEDSLLLRPDYHSALQPVQTHCRASLGHASLAKERSLSLPKGSASSTSNATNIPGCSTRYSVLGTRYSFLSPVLNASFSYNQNTGTFSYKFAQGAYIASNLGKRAGFELSAILYEQKFPGQSYSIDSLELVPRHNRYLSGKGEQAVYGAIRGNIWWKANKWLTLTAGNDKHFIGDGQRSLLLSENAAAYPFFQTRLNIWKINYQHQVMFMRDLVEGAGSKRFQKYTSQHTLSYNHKNRFNFYIFEAVIWRKQDSARHRGFDLSYLNPFLFYRPVEYNQGSPDNVLMGIGGKWRIYGKNYLYGQFILDEFNFKYVTKNNGWWASKYGFQAGFKTYGLWKNKKSLLLLEYNHMRPFTYAHTYSLQNYGYLQQPLAHPLGSSFRELTGVLSVAFSPQWMLHASGLIQRYGTDPDTLNYGSDIYKRQWTFSKFYGNYIGQGILNTVVEGSAEISRILVPHWRWVAFADLRLRIHKTGADQRVIPFLSLGVKTLLYE